VKTVYVDNNATTKVAPEVLEVMLPYFSELYGNPSSMHFFGGQVQKQVDEARAKVAEFLGAEPSEIVFTSCGTESDNAAILGTLDSYPEKRHLITTRVEHPAVGNVSSYLGRKGYRITELSVDREGRLDLDELRESLTDETTLVTTMYANNCQGKGNSFSYRCGSNSRKDSSPYEEIESGYAFHVRAQTACTQGDRSPLYPKGNEIFSVSDRWSPGEREKRRNGECSLHHWPWESLRAGSKAYRG
jgi:hypothetical protein